MRALTLWQPWADLIVWGGKDVENRTWPIPSTVDLPLRIAVHAGLSEERDYEGEAWEAWRDLDLRRAPYAGVVIGTVDVVGYHHADLCRKRTYEDASGFTDIGRCSRWAQPEQYHWQIANAVALDEPIPARGYQGLWRLPDDVVSAVLAS